MRTTNMLAAAAVALVIAVISSPASAIDFTVQLTTIGGAPFKDEKGQPSDIILGTVAENALLAPDSADTTGEAKMKLFMLAVKLHEKHSDKFAKDVMLSVEELSLIKTKIGKFYPPAMVGATYMLLDPASIPMEKKP
jgi:hypothetical protein